MASTSIAVSARRIKDFEDALWNLDPAGVEQALNKGVRAFNCVHDDSHPLLFVLNRKVTSRAEQKKKISVIRLLLQRGSDHVVFNNDGDMEYPVADDIFRDVLMFNTAFWEESAAEILLYTLHSSLKMGGAPYVPDVAALLPPGLNAEGLKEARQRISSVHAVVSRRLKQPKEVFEKDIVAAAKEFPGSIGFWTKPLRAFPSKQKKGGGSLLANPFPAPRGTKRRPRTLMASRSCTGKRLRRFWPTHSG